MEKSLEKNFVTYMENQWVQVEDNILTVGVTEEGMQDIAEILKIEFPIENEAVEADEICGEIETDEAPIQIYSPVKGTIVEINSAVAENPSLISEDPYGDGWLFRVESESADDVEDFLISAEKNDLDDDDDDDDFEEDEDDLDSDDDDLDDDDLDSDDDADDDGPPKKRGRR
jgi:glycine cleavage system H protein